MPCLDCSQLTVNSRPGLIFDLGGNCTGKDLGSGNKIEGSRGFENDVVCFDFSLGDMFRLSYRARRVRIGDINHQNITYYRVCKSSAYKKHSLTG